MLPVSLLFFLFSSPVLSFSFNDSFAIKSAPKTPQNQFHAISVHAPKKEEPPVCCLVPLSPIPSEGEPVEEEPEEVLLSFGEWKERERQMEQKQPKEKDGVAPSLAEENDTHSTDEHALEDPPEGATELLPTELPEWVSPHFQVPLVDRFNYASLDCSARVHASHRSAKSPSSILSSKRDRYMLSPCAGKGGNINELQFVVVELCEDIRIDTVQLANFEFFSGVFKDFTVSVAKSYLGETKKQVWVHAGTYRAKNVRGVQSFHPPRSLTDFYRVIRIDFHSHYSNEYYCPISLLRVYGLTHLEEWKWEMWEAESMANGREAPRLEITQLVSEDETSSMTDETLDSDIAGDTTSSSIYIVGVTSTSTSSTSESSAGLETSSAVPTVSSQHSETGTSISSAKLSSTPSSVSTQSKPILAVSSTPSSTSSSAPTSSVISTSHSRSVSGNELSSSAVHSTIDTSTAITGSGSINLNTSSPPSHASSSSLSSPSSPISAHSSNVSHSHSHSSSHSHPHASHSSHSHSHSPLSVTQIHTQSHVPHASPMPGVSSGGGESIYRTIMNRLGALEGNHSLYTRYVEQQTTTIRGMLSRLSEDVGRLEAIRKSQAATLNRLERDRRQRERERAERKRMEVEFIELMSRVEYLSDEITLEKRLGIAQLCILLTVIVFMGLTRGSRGEVEHHQHSSQQGHRLMRSRGRWSGDLREMMSTSSGLREWGKRQLKLSFSGFGRSRSTSTSEERAREEVDLGEDLVSKTEHETKMKKEGKESGLGLSPKFKFPSPKHKDTGHDNDNDDISQLEPALRTAPPSLGFDLDDSSSSSYYTSRSPSNDRDLGPEHSIKTADFLADTHISSNSASSLGSRPRSRSRSRTPLSSNYTRMPTSTPKTPTRDHGHNHTHTHTPHAHFNVSPLPNAKMTPRPKLQRSNSHGSSPNVHGYGGIGLTPSASWGSPGHIQAPRSVKRWARTAHLHEVKRKKDHRGENKEKVKEKEKDDEDIFSNTGTPSRSKTRSQDARDVGDGFPTSSLGISTLSSSVTHSPTRLKESSRSLSPSPLPRTGKTDEDTDTDSTSWVDTETEAEVEMEAETDDEEQ